MWHFKTEGGLGPTLGKYYWTIISSEFVLWKYYTYYFKRLLFLYTNICRSRSSHTYQCCFFSQKIHLILSACSFPQNHQESRICTLQQPDAHNKVHCPFNNEKRWARLLSDLIFPAHLNRLFPKSVRESALLLSFNRGFNCRNFCSSQLRQFTIWIHICSHFKERGDFKSLKQTKSKLNSFPYKLQVCLTNEIIVALWSLYI